MADEDQSGQAEAQHGGKGRGFVNQQLGALDIGGLIMAPIHAAAKGQEELCNRYINFLMKLAYDTDSTGNIIGGVAGGIAGAITGGTTGAAVGAGVGAMLGHKDNKTKLLKFKLDRPQVNPDGSITTITTEVNAPLLSLVPIPALTMDEVVVDFTMDVSDQFSTTATFDKSDATTTTKTDKGDQGGGFWDWIGLTSTNSEWNNNTVIKGKVTSHRENTRKTDVSAKYTVRARAIQQPATDGMEKLTQLFSAMIEPIATDNKLIDQGVNPE
jgi:hypothetical protein